MTVQQRMYNLTVDVAHTFFVGHGAWLVHNCNWRIGKRSVSEIVDDFPILAGQAHVDRPYVEKFAQDMINGTFDWNAMTTPLEIGQLPNDTLVILNGHHRFVAAQLTDTPIPWDNANAVIMKKLPGWSQARNWDEVDWSY